MAEAPDYASEFGGTALIRTEAPGGMILLRGEMGGALGEAGKRLGVKMPGALQAQLKDGAGLLWMSPDELLMLCPAADVPGHLEALQAGFAGQHAMAQDVSDMRARFSVEGPLAREVLAKLSPLDLSPEGFGQGTIRRTRLGQVAGAIWMTGPERFEVICFRSVGQYVRDLLEAAALPGSEVHLFTHPAG